MAITLCVQAWPPRELDFRFGIKCLQTNISQWKPQRALMLNTPERRDPPALALPLLPVVLSWLKHVYPKGTIWKPGNHVHPLTLALSPPKGISWHLEPLRTWPRAPRGGLQPGRPAAHGQRWSARPEIPVLLAVTAGLASSPHLPVTGPVHATLSLHAPLEPAELCEGFLPVFCGAVDANA